MPDLAHVVEQRRRPRLPAEASKGQGRGPAAGSRGAELGGDRPQIHRPADDGAVVREPQRLGVDGRGKERRLGPVERGGDDGEGAGERDRVSRRLLLLLLLLRGRGRRRGGRRGRRGGSG